MLTPKARFTSAKVTSPTACFSLQWSIPCKLIATETPTKRERGEHKGTELGSKAGMPLRITLPGPSKKALKLRGFSVQSAVLWAAEG